MNTYSSKVMSSMPQEMRSARLAHELNRIFRTKHIKGKYKMGYRSTVAYTIRFTPKSEHFDAPDEAELMKECKASFYVFLAEAKSKYPLTLADKAITLSEEKMSISFFVSDVKWYESYDDVKVHEDLMSLSKEWAEEGNNKFIGGIFVRIGEEMDDIIEESWGEHDWDWVSAHREIVCDWT